MLSKPELLAYFASTDASKLKQQLITACYYDIDNNEQVLKFLNQVYNTSASLPATNKCKFIKSVIDLHIAPDTFSLDIVFLIYSFLNSIPTNSLLFHLDFTNYDTMDMYYDALSNRHYLRSIHSVHVHSDNTPPVTFKAMGANYPALHYKHGYVTFDRKQILVSQSVFQLYRKNGVTVIMLFRCHNADNNPQQQFILNFGNGYAATYRNMEIGVNAGCDPDYEYDDRIQSFIGVHSGRGLALTSFDEQYKLRNHRWYLCTMFIRSNASIAYYMNGSNEPTNTYSQWKGFGNSKKAPFDIGGRIDGNWVVNTVEAHNSISSEHSNCNCHFEGDVSEIIVYDRIISLKEKHQIEKPLLERFHI